MVDWLRRIPNSTLVDWEKLDNASDMTSNTLGDVTDWTTYVKSTNDFSNTDKSKLDWIATGAEVNTVDSVNSKTRTAPSTTTDKIYNVTWWVLTFGWDIAHDSNYIYVCTATDTRKRVAISTR